MRYFVAGGEDEFLDRAAREGRRGAFVQLSAGVTHYELSGPDDGPLVVLIPGLTIPLDFWDSITASIHRRGLRTLAYSAFGRGYSDRVRGPYDRALFVRQLDELLRTVDAENVHLVGSSMGALIALSYLRGQPQNAPASLTLSGPAGVGGTPNLAARLPNRGPIAPLFGKYLLRRALLGHLSHNVATEAEAARLRPLIIDGFRFQGSMYALLSTLQEFPLTDQEDLFDAARSSLPPTMLLWGSADQVTAASGFGRAKQLLRPMRDELLDGVGHMISFERPDDYAERLTAFALEQHG
jgi:pimeloyl-ACP methyl ester carboxylesterase